jgi:hypothetical protein
MRHVLVLTTEAVGPMMIGGVVARVVVTIVTEAVDPGAEDRKGISLPDIRGHNELRNL